MNRDHYILANPDKHPVDMTSRLINAFEPANWSSASEIAIAAANTGFEIAYVIVEDDPTSCIDIDIRPMCLHFHNIEISRDVCGLPRIGRNDPMKEKNQV